MKKISKPLAFLLAMLWLCGLFAASALPEQPQNVVFSYEERQLYASGSSSASQASLPDQETLRTFLFEQLWSCPETIDISSLNMEATAANQTALAQLIWYGIPEAFQVDALAFGRSDNKFVQIKPTYSYDAATYQAMYRQCEAAAQELIGDLLTADLTDLEKALLVHDRIILTCAYNTTGLENNALETEDFSIYGTLVNHTSVCEGYALTYIYLLDKLGIQSEWCSSQSLNHAWNIVYIDGKAYHVDVTYDDPVEDITGRVNHDYFLLSSAALYQRNHEAQDYDTTPQDTTYDNAFWRDSKTAFQLLDGALYYLDNSEAAIKRYDADHTVIQELEGIWYGSATDYYPGNFSRLSSDGAALLYSTPDAVYRLDPDVGSPQQVYELDQETPQYFCIYGFTYQDGLLICDRYDSPNFAADTKELYQVRIPYSFSPPESVWEEADLNNDGDVTIDDALLVLQVLVELVEMPADPGAYDVTGDGATSIDDALLILQYLVELYVPA